MEMIHATTYGWCDLCGGTGRPDIIHVEVHDKGHQKAHPLRDSASQLQPSQRLRLEVFRAFVHRTEISNDDLETTVARFSALIEYGPDEMPILKARHETLVAQRERDEYARRVAAAKEYLTRWDPEDWDGLEEMKIILDGGEP